MSGKITITNQSGVVAVVDIEGIIGVPEKSQFEEPGQRVATYETFRLMVESIGKVSSPEIIVNIRSTGGNINDALLIYEALISLGARITTRCFGYVASAATIIAQAATAGCREISSNALYLIHKSVCAAEGNREEIARTIGVLEKTDDRIASLYAGRSGKAVEQFADLMCENNGNGRWLSPEEAVGYGLADRIIAAAAVPADAGDAVLNLGLPPVPERIGNKKANGSKRWNAVLELLGLAPEKQETEMVREVGMLKEEMEMRTKMIESMAHVQDEINVMHERRVEELRNTISVLEAQNARLCAVATSTKSKEDPSAQEISLTPNQEAYRADVCKFR